VGGLTLDAPRLIAGREYISLMNRSQHSSAVFREWPQALRQDVRTQVSYPSALSALSVLPALTALSVLPALSVL
jgi:hypothetical protein